MNTLAVLSISMVSVGAIMASAASGYHLLQTIRVAGDDGWDHPTIDNAARRLYVTHGTHVVVLDVDSGELVGRIDNTSGAHFVVLDQELDRGFVSHGRGAASALLVFNSKTLETIGRVKTTGENPGPTVFDPVTRRVFTFNLDSSSATVVDARDLNVVGAFDLGGKPELAGTDGNGNVFINLVQKNVVLQIDARRMAVAQSWPVAPCQGPRTMAIDAKNERLFVGCANRLMAVLDSRNGRVIGSVPIGAGPDDSAFDPETRLIYISNGDGTVSVILQETPDKYALLETIQTAPGARNMALDPKTKRIFLPLFDRGPPPAPTPQTPNPRGAPTPGSFRILVYGR